MFLKASQHKRRPSDKVVVVVTKGRAEGVRQKVALFATMVPSLRLAAARGDER